MSTILDVYRSIERSTKVTNDALKALNDIGGVHKTLGKSVAAEVLRIHRQHEEFARNLSKLGASGLTLEKVVARIESEASALSTIYELVGQTHLLFRDLHDSLVDAGVESQEIHTSQYAVMYSAIETHTEMNPEFMQDDILRFWVTYDIVIVLETKTRSVIVRALEKAHGRHWWDTIPTEVKNNCDHFKSRRESDGTVVHPVESYLSLSDMVRVFDTADLWDRSFNHLFSRVDRAGMTDQLRSLLDVRNDTAHLRPIDNTSFALFVWQARFVIRDMNEALSHLNTET